MFDHIKLGYSFQELSLKQRFTEKVSSINLAFFSSTERLAGFPDQGILRQGTVSSDAGDRSAALEYFLSTSLILEKTISLCSSVEGSERTHSQCCVMFRNSIRIMQSLRL